MLVTPFFTLFAVASLAVSAAGLKRKRTKLCIRNDSEEELVLKRPCNVVVTRSQATRTAVFAAVASSEEASGENAHNDVRVPETRQAARLNLLKSATAAAPETPIQPVMHVQPDMHAQPDGHCDLERKASGPVGHPSSLSMCGAGQLMHSSIPDFLDVDAGLPVSLPMLCKQLWCLDIAASFDLSSQLIHDELISRYTPRFASCSDHLYDFGIELHETYTVLSDSILEVEMGWDRQIRYECED